MSLLLGKNARIIGQGITGFEGAAALSWMLSYGTNLVAGVTPGKGGQTLQGIPIFNSVAEALSSIGPVDGTVEYVPPLFAGRATEEAIRNGIGFVLIGAEKMPTKDIASICALAREKNVSLLGPASVGLISPHRKLKLGSIGGGDPERSFIDGPVAVVSKSGGMCSEIGLHLKQNGLGVSFAAGIGGERLIGSDFADFLLEFERDPKTEATVIFGELGGTYEERVAELMKEKRVRKPIVAYIAGEFASKLPSEVQFGHVGALIEGGKGASDVKRKALRAAGVLVADSFDDIARLVKRAIRV